MSKFLCVCGHGQGDPGAQGNGTNEADFTRNELKPALEKWSGKLKSNQIDFYDTSKDMFQQTTANGGAYLVEGYQSVTEWHLDAAGPGATGGHVIKAIGSTPDTADKGLSNTIKKYVGWSAAFQSSEGFSYRNNLLNLNVFNSRGISYRLVELGFIANETDLKNLRDNLDAIAKAFVEAITGETIDGSGTTEPSDPGPSGPEEPEEPGNPKISDEEIFMMLLDDGFSMNQGSIL